MQVMNSSYLYSGILSERGTAVPLSTGQIVNNRYRIDALLGKGGMGAVHRAWDVNLNIPIASKR